MFDKLYVMARRVLLDALDASWVALGDAVVLVCGTGSTDPLLLQPRAALPAMVAQSNARRFHCAPE
jgi:hypothetical protein